MLQAPVEGKSTAQEMAELAKRQLRKKIPELKLALEGKVEEHLSCCACNCVDFKRCKKIWKF